MTLLSAVVLAFANVFYRGLLISYYWKWFMTSQWSTLPHLSTSQAVGVSLFLGVLLPWHSISKKENKENTSGDILYNQFITTFAITLAFGIGALYNWFLS